MTDAEKQLLTAYVDGVATPEEKKRAEALIRSCAEAQQLFTALVNDSLRLKYLRKEKLPNDFADHIVALVRQEVAELARQELWSWRIRRWGPVAVAAAILPWIAWATFALLAQLLSPASPSTVQAPAATSELASAPASTSTSPNVQRPELAQLGEFWIQAAKELGLTGSKLVETLGQQCGEAMDNLGAVVASAWVELEPLVLGDWEPDVPGLAAPSVLTSPVRDLDRNPFRTLSVHLPPIYSWEKFDRAAAQAILEQGRFLVLDVSCRDGERTWERIHAALRTQKIPTLLDARLRSLWKRRQSSVYFVYLENLTAAQAADLLMALYREDRLGAGKPSSDPQIRSILAQPIAKEDRWRLAQLLGVPTDWLPECQPPGSRGTASDHSVQGDTLRKLEQLSKGQSLRPPHTQAVAFSPLRYPPSKEVQQFRQQRGQLRPDGYHLLLLVRPER